MSSTAAFALLAAVAARQGGAFTLDQAMRAGLSVRQVTYNVSVGRILRLHTGVLALAGSIDTPERRLWAAQLTLGPDAVASHRSALWLWDISGTSSLQTVEFTVPVTHRGSRRGIVVHRIADLADTHASTRRGISVTSPLRALVDAGAVLPTAAVEDAFDRAVSRGLVTPAAVLAELERVAKRGRAGVGALRRVLLGQGVGTRRSPSFLEAKARRLFLRAGLPEPVCELKWGDHGQFRLDFVWPGLGLVVEVDGWDCHASHRARQYDLSRRNQLVLGHLRPLVYTYGDIVRRGDAVVDEIRRAMASAA